MARPASAHSYLVRLFVLLAVARFPARAQLPPHPLEVVSTDRGQHRLGARDAARRLSSLRRTARAALSRAGAHPPGCRCCGVLLLHRQRRVLPFYLGLRGRGAGRLGAACAPPCRLGEHTQLAASQPVAGCLRSSSTPKGNTTATSALSSTLGRGCKASHCPRCAST